jgi:ribosomal protein S18 acetylase RimI-like enzyme
MTDELELARYDTRSADAVYGEMVPLYLEANADITHLRFFGRQQFEASFVKQRAHDGFELVTARLHGKLVGVIFGFTEIPEEQYAICEIMVAPAYRRKGVAERLHDELLRLRPERRADLYVRKDNAPAQAAYRKWGWTKVGEIQPAADAPVLDELQLPLPGRGGGCDAPRF